MVAQEPHPDLPPVPRKAWLDLTLLVAIAAGLLGAFLVLYEVCATHVAEPEVGGLSGYGLLLAGVLGTLYLLLMALVLRGSRHARRAFEHALEVHRRGAQLELQQRLMEADRRFRIVVENAPEGVVVCDAQGVIESANPAAHRLFGYADGALVGGRLASRMRPTAPPDRDPWSRDAGTERVLTRQTGLRADGSEFALGLTTQSYAYGGQTHRIALVRDVTAFVEDRKNLARFHDEALAREQVKADLVATMSHEIRTPLNGIVGMVQLLVDEELRPEQHALAQQIQQSSRSLVAILDDVLQVSSMNAGALVLEQANFDVLELVEEVVVLHYEAAGRRGLELVMATSSELQRDLRGDPHRVRQVVSNLVSNAVKFTHTGYVLIGLTTRDVGLGTVELEVTVQDTGIGIPADKLEAVFDRYARVTEGGASGVEGTGLGLAIARDVARLMGGDVAVHSRRGEGTVFTFVARLLTAAAPEVPRVSAVAGVRVLVAVKSRVGREQVMAFLASHGAICSGAAGAGLARAELAAARAQGRPFAVVLADRELCEDGDVDRGDARLVLLCRLTDRVATQDAVRLGAVRLVRRPVLLSRLVATVAAAVDAPAPSASVRAAAPVAPSLGNPPTLTPTPTLMPAPTPTRSPTPTLPPSPSELPSANTEPARPIVLVGGRFAGRRVLVAEDDPTNQRVALVMVSKLGCVVEVAANGRDAIAKARVGDFDLIFMDCQMPELDGYAAVREIRSWGGRFAALPIIALTAHGLDGDRERSLAAGMSDHLTKPVTRKSFQDALERWLPPAGRDDGPG